MSYNPAVARIGATLTLTDAATINWDTNLGAVAEVTLAGNRAIALPTNGTKGTTYRMVLTQDATGSRTITDWDDFFRFTGGTPPTLTTTAEYSDILDFYFDGTYYVLVNSKLNLKLFEDPPLPSSLIAQVIPIEITMTAPTEIATQSVSVGTRANAILIFNGCFCANSTANYESLAHLTLNAGGTLVTASRNSVNTPSFDITVRGTIIEFVNGVIEKQEDKTISPSAANAIGTLASSYTTSLSCAIYRGHKYAQGSSAGTGATAAVSLTSSTQITAYCDGAGGVVDVECTAVQFYSTFVNRVQSFVELIEGGTNLTDSITLSNAVVTANTMLIFNGWNSNSGGLWRETATRIAITGTNTVTATRANSTSANRRICGVAIEFIDGYVNSNQAGTVTMSGVSNNTAAISAINTSKSVVINTGFTTTLGAVSGLHMLPAVKINSSTAIRADHGDNSSACTAGFQAFEFV